jgi:xanthine dehydrogenase molybdenum-binding subunit
MRGFGANQAAFAIDSMIDILAEVGLDGWEIRYLNALDIGGTFCTGQQFESSVGLKKTLEAVKDVYKNAGMRYCLRNQECRYRQWYA